MKTCSLDLVGVLACICLIVGMIVGGAIFIAGDADNVETRANTDKLIQQCEATLPRNLSCKIVFSTEVVENKE